MPDFREDSDQLGIDAWVLCAEFVDRIVSEARESDRRDHPDRPPREIDVEAIWRAGDGAPSDELAIGRIVRAASEAVREVTGVAPGAVVRPVESSTSATPPVAPSATFLAAGAATTSAPVEPVADESPAVARPVFRAEPLAPADAVSPPEAPAPEAPEAAPATTVVDAVAPVDEMVTAPVAAPVAPFEPGQHEQPLPAMLPAPFREPIAALEEPGAPSGEKRRTRVGRVFKNRPAWLTAFTWIEIIGAFIILFVGWQLWGTAISQAQDQNQLKTQFDKSLREHHAPTAAAAKGALIPAGVNFPSPADGSVVAEIQIPSIGVDQYVVSGTSATDLSKGPGHYVGTALPGQAGNVGIAGHRTTHGAPFNRLGDLKPGDKIVLVTTWGEHLTYVVSAVPVAVAPNDVAVLNYFGDNRITLTTCTPEYSAAQRLVAVGTLEGHKTRPLPPAGHVEYHIANAGTASWDWALLPAVGVELSLLVLLGLSYRRTGAWFGRHAKWFILVPVWAAGLYLLFDTLTTFLPDTI